MLTEKDFELLEKEAVKLYSDLEFEIIQEMAERIANVGYANTVVYNNAVILQEMGVLYTDIINLVAKYNEQTSSEILKIFENAGIKSLERDDSIYKLAGLNPKGLNESMVMLLEATAKKTHNNLSNLAQTTASASQTNFINTMNKAYMEVSTGVKSYSQSIIDAIDELSEKGTLVIYPSGYKTSLENAVRMNILTSVNQTSGKLQELRAEEMGWDLVEVSAHGGARPEHANWQGKVYSLKGITKGYKTLEEGCDYGRVTGLCGVNCRHTFFPYYKGSTRTYTNKELTELKNETVIYNGQKIGRYDASQIQRAMERKIRQDKKDIAGLQGILKSETTDNELITKTKGKIAKKTLIYNTHKQELNNLVEQINTKVDNSRLVVGVKYNSSQLASITKMANEFNNSKIVGMKVNNTKISEIGEHIISQTYARGLKVSNIEDTLQRPVKYGKIRKDNSQQIYGESCVVVVNIQTGKLITTYPKKTKRK